MKSESLETTEAVCAEGRTAPRVSLTDIEKAIAFTTYFTGDKVLPQALPEDAAYAATSALCERRSTPASF